MLEINLLKQVSILYVEDDTNLASLVIDELKIFCNNVNYCENGEDGLNFYKQNHKNIDIVITDINMPILDGLEMTKYIRELNADIPIVINSAFNDQDRLINAINLGVDGFLPKPLLVKDLVKILVKVFKPIYYQRQLKQKDALIFQQSKLAAIGEMIGNIAHQWRQPLNSIGVLMMKLELNNENDNLSKEIVSNTINDTNQIVRHMSKTIDDFKDFFIPNKNKDTFIIKDIIDSLSSLMIPQLENYNIEFKTIGDLNIELYGYSNELKQVLLNIIGNAKDAIRTNDIQNGFIEIAIEKKDDNVVFYIKDNSGGVPEDIIDKIFEPYFTTKFKSQGTGLGLYISKVIIEKNMYGLLSVSNENNCTIFKITLPINLK